MQQTLTHQQSEHIYNLIQELVDIATLQNVSIYAGRELDSKAQRIAEIRDELELQYRFRFVAFKQDGDYITDLSYPEQWTFALFVAEFVLSGDWQV